MAGDDGLCHLILTLKRHSKWKTVKEGEGGKEYELTHGRRKESLWDPRFWPAYLWCSGIPHKYLYAVARAFGDHGIEEGLADGFRHYLALMDKRKSGEVCRGMTAYGQLRRAARRRALAAALHLLTR